MALDLSKLPKPSRLKQHLNPIDIFNSLPRLKDSPNDLWAAQQQILLTWHAQRQSSDVVINLNTGAGKSIVGLLIAQSLVNERIGPVIYCCATNDLVQQTAGEAERKLGLKFTTRMSGEYNNTLFEEGNAFLITNYHAAFQAFSVFRGQLAPAAIIFDDAHVAEKIIRDCMSVRITKRRFSIAYEKIKALIRDYFVAISKHVEFQAILSGASDSVIFVPIEAILPHEMEILTEIQALTEQDNDIKYANGHLAAHLKHCFVTLSNEQIEFTPAFLPTLSLGLIASTKTRRIYLSATMSSDAEFIRTFGRAPTHISVETDAGNGERLVVYVDKLKGGEISSYYREQVAARKVLFAVPSAKAGERWSEFGSPTKTADFTRALSTFKRATHGAFILVQRVDGIDLPGDTCRIMVLDGLPTGISQFEKFIDGALGLNDFLNTKITTRITQLFGRINRGRSDYGVFLIHDPKLAIWLRRDRNLALMPPTLQKQLLLGQMLVEQMKFTPQVVSEFTDAVMDRDSKWTDYYQSYLESMEVDTGAVKKSREVSDSLCHAALHEARAASALWDGRYDEARNEYAVAIEKVRSIDEGLAGFYMLLVGNVFAIEGDETTARKHYHLGQMKLPRGLVLPRVQMTISSFKSAEMNPFQEALCDVFVNDLVDSNRNARSLIKVLEKLTVPDTGASEYDEALKQLGLVLGFVSTRPDQVSGGGPDVLWEDKGSSGAVAFETKVEKGPTATYSKKEIGQSHNHLQWIKDNKKGRELLGLAIVGDSAKADAAASPSDQMYFVPRDAIKGIAQRIRDLVTRIDLQTPLERRGSIYALKETTEFELANVWRAISKGRQFKRR